MKVRIQSCQFYVTDCTTRMPFRYGAVTFTGAPLCVARITLETEAGGTTTGYSSDLLAPRWFDKDPAKTPAQNIRDLADSARAASAAIRGMPAASVFDHWWRLQQQLVEGRLPAARLVHGFGVALVERAVMDATCRAAGLSFFAALQQDLFWFRPAMVDARWEGWSLAQSLPEAPLSRVSVRHTVGLGDPLDATDLEEHSRVGDGLPETLEEDIRRHGLTHFKIKLSGDPGVDAHRLTRISEVWRRTGIDQPKFTLDGNEVFVHLGEIRDLLRRLSSEALVAPCLKGLMYIEQPLARAVTFDPDRLRDLPAVQEFAPVIIDEADHGVRSFSDAADLGYDGVSVKNCKGVFKALLNLGVCRARGPGRGSDPGGAGRPSRVLFQTSEDLTNLPVLALQQDLVTCSVLGLSHSERNGHHYFRRLEHLPAAEAEAALAAHPDLYRRSPHGIELRLEGGALRFPSLHRPGYGHDSPVDVTQRLPLDEWAPVLD